MKIVLVGYGEVGESVYHVITKQTKRGVWIHDPVKKLDYPRDRGDVDLMLIAIPYSHEFIDIVKQYQKEWKVKETIIFSTVAIGTSRQCDAVHSLIDAPHPTMAFYILNSPRWVGGQLGEFGRQLFKEVGFILCELDTPEQSEFLKLRSLMYYGMAIEFARYSKRISDELGLIYDCVKKYDQDYNRINAMFGRFHLQRYVLDPPKGRIGGHCIIQNLPLLHKEFPHPFGGYIIHKDIELEKEEKEDAISK